MRKLICLGDSLTFGLRVSHSLTWPRLVSRQTGMPLENLGLNGDTTGGMLARLQSLAAENSHNAPKDMPILVLMGGSNDIFYAGTDTGARANMGAMIHQAITAHMVPVVGIPLPISPDDAPENWGGIVDFREAAANIEGYCVWLKAFCKAFSVPFVDFHQDFLTEEGAVRRELFADGLHPNAQGHQIMAQRLLKAGVLK